MIIRIVRLSFKPENISDFKNVFDENEKHIAGFPGCSSVTLLQDRNNPEVFFTYSLWDAEESLENYRKSPLFNQVWGRVKPYFNDRPLAWSCNQLN
jgi:heme-degrading monooxygenase HmoA